MAAKIEYDYAEQSTDTMIYLLDVNQQPQEDLLSELNSEGCQIQHFRTTEDFNTACDITQPAAAIIDTAFDDGGKTFVDIKALCDNPAADCPPLIFLSEQPSITSRLAAARLGASYYFQKPLNKELLRQALRDITKKSTAKALRILLINDDKAMLKNHAATLRSAGMEVKTLSQPLKCLELMAKFKPDILLIELYMTECAGTELAQVIWQDHNWALLPILFLSSESQLHDQLKTKKFERGDFLLKPVADNDLITTLTVRAKRARLERRRNHELEAALIENKFQLSAVDQHDIISTTDITGKITAVNDKFCAVSGYSRKELLGQNHRLLKSDHHPQEFYDDLWQTISTGKVWHGRICNRKKNGREYWVESTIVPFLNAKGKPYKYISARTDITSLQQSEERLNNSQEFAKLGSWDWDIKTGIVYWSDRIWPLFGLKEPPQETTKESFLTSVHPDDRQMLINAMNDCLLHGTEYNIEHRLLWPDGSSHWVHERGDVKYDKNGAPLNMMGVMQDIDTRKRAEMALVERERQLQAAQKIAKVGNWQTNMQNKKIIMSDEIYRIVGRDSGYFKDKRDAFFKLMHPDDVERVRKYYDKAEQASQYDIEFRIIRPDGEVRHVHELAATEKDPAGNIIGMRGTVQDITERVIMRDKLKLQRSMLDMLHHLTTDFVINGDFTAAMNNMLTILLQLTESPIGFTGEVLSNEDGSPYMRTHAITDVSWDAETKTQYKNSIANGFEFHNLDTLFGQIMTSGKTILSNDPASDPHAGGLPDGHPALNSFLGVPVFYGHKLVGMYGIANRDKGYDDDIRDFLRPFDITYGAMIHAKRVMDKEEQTRLALIDAREEAMTANRAKSQFLSSMSHELRTPMNAIMGFSQLLTMEEASPLNDSQKENVNEIVKASHHLLELVNEVLDLAKIEAGRIDLSMEIIALADVLAESLHLITPLAQKRGIEINLSFNGQDITFEQLPHQHCAIRADRTRLKQIFLNLLSNAIKYNTENGKLTITCTAGKDKKTRINIDDTGAGLTPQQQKQLFKPFMRIGNQTAEVEGVGIGLVITKNLTELMGGTIGMKSKLGAGSRFWVEFPSGKLHPSQKNLAVGEEKMPPAQDTSELDHEHSILYIEDNPANLRLVTQLLGRHPNIHVWSAHEPLLGLELAASHKPDLILLDINLPTMNGYEVLKNLRRRKGTHDTPVIAISANAMPSDIKKGQDAGFNDYITKPINVEALLQAIEKTLHGGT